MAETNYHGEVVLALQAGARSLDEVADWLWGDPDAMIRRDSFICHRALCREVWPDALNESARIDAVRRG